MKILEDFVREEVITMTNRKEKPIEAHKDGWIAYYHTYRADYCRATGLPMISRKTYSDAVTLCVYTKTMGKNLGIVLDTSVVVAWYKTQNGYVPMFHPVSNQDNPFKL